MPEWIPTQASMTLENIINCPQVAEAVLETVTESVLLLDEDLRITFANGSFLRTFGGRRGGTFGLLFEIGEGEWDTPELRGLLNEVLHSGGAAERRLSRTFSGVGYKAIRVFARSIRSGDSKQARVVLAVADVTNLERALDERLEFKERYGTLVDTAQEGIWTIDASGTTTFANRTMAEMLGTTIEDMISRPSSDFVFKEDADRAAELFRRKVQGDREPFEFRLRRKDGSWFWASVAGTPFHNSRGETTGLLGTFRDITERKLAEDAASRHADELARSTAALEQFAHITSHDLREPLRSMRSFAQLLGRKYGGKLDRDADEFIGFIISGAERMDNLIADLVAYCNVTERDGSITTNVDLAKTVDWAKKNLATRIADTAATVKHRDLPVIAGDELQLVQMFQNLLSNAIKYRRSGEAPRVEILAELHEGQWRVSVRDNGIGIPEDRWKHVFGIFRRLHGPEVPGTGIGLAICRKIAENHGGKIWVESRVGEGSTFFFTLSAREEVKASL